MKKNAVISLVTNDEKTKYNVEIEKINGKISYQEKTEKLTNVLYNIEEKILIREDEEIYMEYDFKNEKGSIFIKDLRKNISIPIKVKSVEETDNKIDVTYFVDKDLYEYSISIHDKD